jgi:preprotein translocase subunit SecG
MSLKTTIRDKWPWAFLGCGIPILFIYTFVAFVILFVVMFAVGETATEWSAYAGTVEARTTANHLITIVMATTTAVLGIVWCLLFVAFVVIPLVIIAYRFWKKHSSGHPETVS